VLTGALVVQALAGSSLLVVVLLDPPGGGGPGLAAVLPALFVVVASLGCVIPNSTALALARHPRTAGSASAMLGSLQFLIGAGAAPLTGGTGARPLGIVVATMSAAALVALLALTRHPETAGAVDAVAVPTR
jgi:DHA1 family bicyclomycin/chloramphenicol resistance-like MFS transporter